MLELLYDTFAPTGEWPLFQYVIQVWNDPQVAAREVYLELAERGMVYPRIARIHAFQLRDNTSVGVSLQGLMHLDAAAGDIANFVSAVRYIAGRVADFQPESATKLSQLSVTSEEIRLHLNLEPGDPALQRVAMLIREEAWQLSTVFHGPDNSEWSLDVNLERARGYKDIYTVIDFLDISYPGDPPSVPRPASSGPRFLRPVRQRLARDKPRMIDYILATLMITVVGGVAVALLTRGSSSAGNKPIEAASLKSSSTSGARVFLAQGVRKGDEYEYAISVDGFPSHSSMMVSCRDGAHPQGFEFFEIATNPTGTASIAVTPCYSPGEWITG